MTFIGFLGMIYSGIQNIQSIQGLQLFVKNDMLRVIESIGDIHYSAAKLALRDVQRSMKPEREISAAIIHLREAYEAFCKAAKTPAQKSFWVFNRIDSAEEAKQLEKACQCAVLIAICYKALNEPLLSRDYIQQHAMPCFAVLAQYKEACIEPNNTQLVQVAPPAIGRPPMMQHITNYDGVRRDQLALRSERDLFQQIVQFLI